jgi:GT2 family glycosyltransferase
LASEIEHDGKLPFVSVVIPTLNRKALLKNCLDSLFSMDYPRSRFEAIVVDNGCTDGTKEMIHRDFSEVRFLTEKKKGVVYARNTGSRLSNGLIVAYTDDDCIVDNGWLRNLVSGFTSSEVGAVGGPVFHLHSKSVPEELWCYRTAPFYLGEKERLAKFLVSGNLSVRREVFEKIRFDESFIFHDSEDIDFSKSIAKAGYRLLYVPHAKVYHNVDPQRSRLQYIIRRAFLAGLSLYIIDRKYTNGILIPRFLRSLLGGLFDFLRERKVANFYWLIECFAAFLSSIFLFAQPRRSYPNTCQSVNQ